MKYFFLFVLTVFSSILTAQNDYTFECAIVEEDNPKFDFSKFKRIDNKECKNKIIRLNIHFILREDNTSTNQCVDFIFNNTDIDFLNDGPDTPTPWEMCNIYNSTCHPACGWGTGSESGCSNNTMDYNGSYALSEEQLKIIHIGLEHPQGTKRFRVCTQLNQNNTFCEFEGYPQISYYGDKIRIAPCAQEMLVEEEAIVHYNEEVEFFSNFEVVGSEPRNDNLVFEVRQHCKCRL